MNNKYKVLLKDTGIFALGNFGSKLLLFLLVPFYTNVLSTEQYGTVELVLAISNLIIPFVSLNIHSAVLRYGMSKSNKREDALLCGVVVWVISSIILLGLIQFVELYDAIAQWKWYLYFLIITSDATSISLNYLKVKNKNKFYALISVTQTAIIAFLNIYLLVFLKKGINGYLLSSIVAHTFTIIAAFCLANQFSDLKSAKIDRRLMFDMIKYSSPLIFNNVSWWLINSLNKVLIEVFLGVSALGIYTVSVKIPSLINVITSIFTQAWSLSSIKEVETSNDKSFFKNIFQIYSFVVFMATIGFVTIIKPFMSIYVGKDFASSWKYVPLLLCGACFYAISSYFGSMYSALKRTVNTMTTTFVSAIVNVIISFIGIKLLGVWGAVCGTVSSYIVVALLRLIDVRKYINFKIEWRQFIINIILILSQSILVSINWNIYLVSAIVIVIFIINNFSQFVFFFKKISSFNLLKR